MPFVAFTFTDAQVVDIRRFCGYPAYGPGNAVFPAPWLFRGYLALEYRIQNMNTAEGNVVVNTYLHNLTTLENAIVGTGANLDTAQAAVWIHNKNELRDRENLFASWRMKLCQFLGIPSGEGLQNGISLVV